MLIYVKVLVNRTRYFILFTALLLQATIVGQTDSKKLCLKEAIEIGLKNNPEIRSADENISASKGRFWNGIALPQPQVELNYEFVPTNKNLGSYDEKTWAISQSFEFPTNYFLRGSKFNKEEDIFIFRSTSVKRKVINQIKACYYKVLTKQNQVKSAEENLKISEDFFKKAGIKQNVGEGTNLERLTAKVQFAEAKNNLEVAQNDLTAALSELNFTLGNSKEYSHSKLILTDTLQFIHYEINFEQLTKSLDETNPQIKIAESNFEIASLEKSLAWTSLLPNFSLSYFRQTRDGNNGFYGAAFGISVPLWFAFEQRGKIQEASANQSISESESQLVKNQETLKLKNAFTEYGRNLKQVQLYTDEILPQSEEVYRSATKSYDAGEITYIEYTLAKQTLIGAKNDYFGSLFNYYQSLFLIEEISGLNITDNMELEK